MKHFDQPSSHFLIGGNLNVAVNDSWISSRIVFSFMPVDTTMQENGFQFEQVYIHGSKWHHMRRKASKKFQGSTQSYNVSVVNLDELEDLNLAATGRLERDVSTGNYGKIDIPKRVLAGDFDSVNIITGWANGVRRRVWGSSDELARGCVGIQSDIQDGERSSACRRELPQFERTRVFEGARHIDGGSCVIRANGRVRSYADDLEDAWARRIEGTGGFRVRGLFLVVAH